MRVRRLLVLFAVLAAGCETETVNRPPVAIASEDAHLFLGASASLDGAESSDPEEDPLELSWQVQSAPAGSAFAPGAVLSAATSFDFTPDVAGTYLVSLTATDPDGLFATDLVVVEARPPLRVVHLVPADGETSVAGLAPVVAIFDAPIRPWTAATLLVEDVTDPLAPVPVLGNAALDAAGSAIVFTPVAAWVDAVPYRVTVPVVGPMGLDGAPLAADRLATFTGAAVDTEPPRVVPGGVTPAPAEPAAPLSTVVDVFFSEAVDPASVALAFSLAEQGGAVQDGAVELAAGGVVARFVPADTVPDPDDPQALAASTDWSFGIADTLTDLAGIALDGDSDGVAGTDFASTFTTVSSDTAAPTILSVSPFRGASGVSVKLPTVITFSEPVEPASVVGAVVLTTGGAATVGGGLTLVAGHRVAVFTPADNLSTATRYDLAVSSAVTDLAGNALSAFGSFFLTGASPPPEVLSTLPDGAPVGETVTIDILGEDFVNGAAAVIAGGGVLVSSTTYLSPTQLQANVTLAPSAAFGFRSLVVTNPDGQQGTGAGVFEVRRRPPTVTSINPSTGSRGSPVTISVTGSDFDCSGGTPPTVSLNDAAVADVSANCLGSTSATTTNIQATFAALPAGATVGAHSLTVTNPDLTSGSLPGAFDLKAEPPDATSISLATSGRRRESLTVQVNGAFFQATPTVSFGAGIGVASVTLVSSTQLLVDVTVSSTAALGTRNVTVTNPDGQSDALTAVFTVLRAIPTVTGTTPSQGSRSPTAFDVTVNGSDFDCSGAAAVVPDVVFSDPGITVSSISCNGDTTEFAIALVVNVTLTGAATTGAKNVSVTNPSDVVTGTGFGVFTVRAEVPTALSASPDPKQGETVEVTVTGTFFQATPTVNTTVAGATIGAVTFVSATEIRVFLTIPPATMLQTYGLTVINPDGQSTGSQNILTVVTAPPPAISGIAPATGAKGSSGLVLTVTGTDFQNGATVSISGDGITNNGTTFVSTTTLTVNVDIALTPAPTFGVRDVTVTNPVGTVNTDTEIGIFRVTDTPPTVTGISPASAPQGASLVGVTIDGANFRASPTVTLPGGFVNGMTVSNVTVNGPGTQITCDIALAGGASVGFRSVTVTNTDTSSGNLANGFTVTSAGGGPVVSAVIRGPSVTASVASQRDDAASLRQGETATVHLLGANFDPASTVTVSGAGVTVGGTTFFSTTRLDVALAVSCADIAPGRRDVTVTNPDGKTGTLVDGLVVRHGVVINEVATQPRTGHGFGGASREVVELFNGRDPSCAAINLTNWRLDFIDTDGVTGVEIGDVNLGELYSAGSTRIAFASGGFAIYEQPDLFANNMDDDVFVSLFSSTGRFVDDVEIGDNEENDSATDGAPASGNDGANSGTAEEMVARCPNGSDTDVDIPDFYQNELTAPLTQQAATDRASNNGECPPCANGLDDDADGWIDLLDAGCTNPHTDAAETGDPVTECNDNVDNGDADFLVDQDDPDCFDGADTSEAS